jgi:hypothetical protein
MHILKEQNVKAILAILGFLALIVGFFMQLITSESFLPIVVLIVQHYFHRDEVKTLSDRIDEKDGEIRALATGKVKIVELP